MSFLRLVLLGTLILAFPLSALPEETPVAFPPASPESVGLDPAALEALAGEVRDYLEKDYLVGGELLVIKSRRTVLHEVYGHADRESDLPWTRGTVANIRSMTKPLTGAAIQILADRGKLDLEDPVSRYLPGFDTDASREITIRQVLTHRAGLPLTILKSIEEYETLVDMGNAVGIRGPEFEPESRFWYSDSGTDVLGALVEIVSERTIDEFVRTELLEPLGMTDSFYYLDKGDPRRAKISSLYNGSPKSWNRFLDPDDAVFYPYGWGSQSLYSTPMDYAKFLALWMDRGRANGKQILSRKAVRRSLTPTSEMSMLGSEERFPTSFRGMEVYYGQMAVLHVPLGSKGEVPAKIVGHSGSDGTIAWAWPERDLMILYFTQSRGGKSALRLEEAIDRLLISPEAYAGSNDVPEPYRDLVGTYIADWSNHSKEEFVVHVKNGELAIDVPTQMDFALTPVEGEEKWKFTVAPTITVWFEKDDEGRVDCLRIQQGPLVFEAPRQGTPHEKEYFDAQRADPVDLARYLGEYANPDGKETARVHIDGDYLAVESSLGQLFHLWKVPIDDIWVVKENPVFRLTFEEKDGVVVSFTRRPAMGGETTVFKKVK